MHRLLPLSFVTFGGTHGQDLEHLQGLTVFYCGASHNTLAAIEFSYADGRAPLRLGLETTADVEEKVAMRINGPGGERIVGLEVCYTPEQRLRRFKVNTYQPSLLGT